LAVEWRKKSWSTIASGSIKDSLRSKRIIINDLCISRHSRVTWGLSHDYSIHSDCRCCIIEKRSPGMACWHFVPSPSLFLIASSASWAVSNDSQMGRHDSFKWLLPMYCNVKFSRNLPVELLISLQNLVCMSFLSI
jgi:hypothetical protein